MAGGDDGGDKGDNKAAEVPAGFWDTMTGLLYSTAQTAQKNRQTREKMDADLENSLQKRGKPIMEGGGDSARGHQLLRELALEASKQLSLDDGTDPTRRGRVLEKFFTQATGKDMSFYNSYSGRILSKFKIFNFLVKDASTGATNREALLLKLMKKTNNLFQVLAVLDACPPRYLAHTLAIQAMEAPLGVDYDIKFTKLLLHLGIQKFFDSINLLSRTLAWHELMAATGSPLSHRVPTYERGYSFKPASRRMLTPEERRRARALQKYIPILQRENAFWKCKILNLKKSVDLKPSTEDDLLYRVSGWGIVANIPTYIYNFFRARLGFRSNNQSISSGIDLQSPPELPRAAVKQIVLNYFTAIEGTRNFTVSNAIKST